MNDRSSVTHSNSELNICPHIKGSTKSMEFNFIFVKKGIFNEIFL